VLALNSRRRSYLCRLGSTARQGEQGMNRKRHLFRSVVKLVSGICSTERYDQPVPVLALDQLQQTVITGFDRPDLVRSQAVAAEGSVGIVAILHAKCTVRR
jgi:hypothetical protein